MSDRLQELIHHVHPRHQFETLHLEMKRLSGSWSVVAVTGTRWTPHLFTFVGPVVEVYYTLLSHIVRQAQIGRKTTGSYAGVTLVE